MSYFTSNLKSEYTLYNLASRYNVYKLTGGKVEIGRRFDYSNSKEIILPGKIINKLSSIGITHYKDLQTCAVKDLKDCLLPEELEKLISIAYPFFDELLNDDEIRELVCYYSFKKYLDSLKHKEIIIRLLNKTISTEEAGQYIQKGQYFSFAREYYGLFVEKYNMASPYTIIFDMLYPTLTEDGKNKYKFYFNLREKMKAGNPNFDILKIKEITKSDLSVECSYITNLTCAIFFKNNYLTRVDLLMLEDMMKHNIINQEQFLTCLTPSLQKLYKQFLKQN